MADKRTDIPDTSRRHALECMLWAGSGIVWTMVGGIPRSTVLAATPEAAGFSFVQISDSHLGFSAAPNTDVTGTLQEALDQAKKQPGIAMMIHTGDVSHLSRAAQFDTAAQLIGATGIETHYVPGEHDVLDDDGKSFFARFTKGGPRGWYSFDQGGVHFVGLNNVQNLQAGGLGFLGADQLDWLAKDLAGRPASTPIVVFAHVPLWTVSAEWGWGTADAEQALALLRRFGSVTVLNGHIHQIMQKIEGQVAFHTARSTAFPQPAPGTAPSPGPIKTVQPGQLRGLLGISSVKLITGTASLAIVDSTLEA
jgi:Icc protein